MTGIPGIPRHNLYRVSGQRVRRLGQHFCYRVRILHFRFQAKPRDVFVLGR